MSMSGAHLHEGHPQGLRRLGGAEGHPRHVIGMIEAGAPCAEIARQPHAGTRAQAGAERALIRDHICLCDGGEDAAPTEVRPLAKLR